LENAIHGRGGRRSGRVRGAQREESTEEIIPM